jgi:tetratricopeptide (TPR) repeat protein
MAAYDKEFIIRYAEGELTEEERRKFEADLLTDPSLAAGLSLYQEVKTTLQQRLQDDTTGEALRATLSDLNRTYFAPPAISPAKHISLTRWVAGVAAAASIIIAVVLLLPSRNSEDVFDRLGHTEMVGTSERGGDTDSLLQQAAVFFNRQEFGKALPLLDKAVRSDSSQLALFYRGVAEWHTGAIDAARKDLGQVYNGESLLRYEAAFYIALTYAGEKNSLAAKEWLKRIPEGTPVSDRAKELGKKL